jgi:hypothetical protein
LVIRLMRTRGVLPMDRELSSNQAILFTLKSYGNSMH